MKYEKLSQTLTNIMDFTRKHQIQSELLFFTYEELRKQSEQQDEYWAKFENYGATYCFFNLTDNALVYVGKSLNNSGNRLFHWIFQDKDKVNDRISNDDIILVCAFPEENYMSSALESYLIHTCKPERNKRG